MNILFAFLAMRMRNLKRFFALSIRTLSVASSVGKIVEGEFADVIFEVVSSLIHETSAIVDDLAVGVFL
jgi:hypothetical protein